MDSGRKTPFREWFDAKFSSIRPSQTMLPACGPPLRPGSRFKRKATSKAKGTSKAPADGPTDTLAHWDQEVSAGQRNLIDPTTTPIDSQDLTFPLAAWTGPGPAASPLPAATQPAGPRTLKDDSLHRAGSQRNPHHPRRRRGLHRVDLRHQHRRYRLSHGRRADPATSGVQIAPPQRLRRTDGD